MADDAWLGDLHTQVGRMGGAHRLYMAVPRAIAAELTLCNAQLTAERCYELGIVNAVVPKDQLIPTAEELAERVCNASPLAVQAAVRLYNLCSEFSPEMSALARHLDQETAETEDAARKARAPSGRGASRSGSCAEAGPPKPTRLS
jgi:enoyl-CoA hydratase/carnithine racemase